MSGEIPAHLFLYHKCKFMRKSFILCLQETIRKMQRLRTNHSLLCYMRWHNYGKPGLLLVLLDFNFTRSMDKKLTYEQLESKIAELEKKNEVLEVKFASVISRHKAKREERKADFQISQFSKAFDKLSTYIYIKDIEGRYLYANKQILELFNLSTQELFGKNDSFFHTPETAATLMKADKCVLINGEDVDSEIKLHLPDGTERIYKEVKTPIYDNMVKNKIIGLCGISTDITEMKRSESILKENEKQLLEFNATKDKFFSIIAHDLRTPFNNILGLTQLLTNHFKNRDYAGIEEYVGIIQDSTERGLKLIGSLFQWAQSQTGQMKFNPESFDVAHLVKEITELKASFAGQKTIHISYQVPFNINISADKEMVRTVLRNLVSNAIKFTNPGGEIQITAEQKQDEIVMSVIDNGVGIEESTINKLFLIEENISSNGTNNEKGTGLGLILCKEFVEMHKGKIWANSVKGKGSEFRFTLPIAHSKHFA